jgi:tetratricopeptide (TPR) repeat protein
MSARGQRCSRNETVSRQTEEETQAANSNRMTRQSNIHRAGIRVIFAVLPWFLAPPLVFAACTPPDALSARLKTSPSSESYADAGNWYAGQKQFECAAAAFASAFQLKPSSASLAYLWGLSLYSAGQDEPAVKPLNLAKQLDPSDIRPHLVLAAVLDRLKEVAAAEAEWRAALAIDPDSAPALDGLSQDLVGQKDYAGVIALLDKPGTTRARTSTQSLNLGMAYVGTAQLDSAIAVLRGGLNSDPGSLPIADELSMVLMLQGREDEAFAVFKLALDKHPGDQVTQLLYLRAMVSSHAGEAVEYAHKLLAAYPNQWEVLYLNAILESQEGDFRAARSHLERSIEINSGYSQSQAELGSILARLDDLPGAKQHLEKAIALGDADLEVQYDLAKVLQRLGDTAAAQEKLQIYQQLKRSQADRVQAAGKAEEGDQAMSAGNAAQAASLYREALASDPDEPLLFYKLSRALDKIKDIDGEKTALQQAIRLNPDLAEAQNQMGYLAAHEGDSALAEGYFRAAVHASPSYAAAWINLAATLASDGKWKEAKEALGHALEIDPDNADARGLSRALASANPGP